MLQIPTQKSPIAPTRPIPAHRSAWAWAWHTLPALTIAALLATAAPHARAEDNPETPTRLAGGQIIDVEQAHAMLAAKKALFIDTRNALNFGKGHVPGARIIAYKEKSGFTENFDASLDSFEAERLPADKRTPLVIYSHGTTGWKSYKASVLAIRLGYTHVHYLRPGLAAWEAAHLPIEE